MNDNKSSATLTRVVWLAGNHRGLRFPEVVFYFGDGGVFAVSLDVDAEVPGELLVQEATLWHGPWASISTDAEGSNVQRIRSQGKRVLKDNGGPYPFSRLNEELFYMRDVIGEREPRKEVRITGWFGNAQVSFVGYRAVKTNGFDGLRVELLSLNGRVFPPDKRPTRFMERYMKPSECSYDTLEQFFWLRD